MASSTPTIGLVRRGYSESGGAERYLSRFAAGLRSRDYDLVLFASADWPDYDKRFSEVKRLDGSDPMAFANALQELRPWKYCDILFSFERVWEADFYRAGDGVHAAWLDRRKQYRKAYKTALQGLNRKHKQLIRLESSLFAPHSKTRVIANSEFVKHEILQYYGTPAERIDVVYNGFKPPAIKGNPRETIRERLGLNDPDVMLLFAGSGWERKGLVFAAEAAAQLRQDGVRFFVAGKGNPKSLPYGVHKYLGQLEDMTPYYEAADIFILPTIYDPFSNACLEAAAHGLPVITTTANGFSEIMIHGHQGEVVDDASDVAGLIEGVRRWLSGRKRAEHRELIRRWAGGFHVRDNVENTLAIVSREKRIAG